MPYNIMAQRQEEEQTATSSYPATVLTEAEKAEMVHIIKRKTAENDAQEAYERVLMKARTVFVAADQLLIRMMPSISAQEDIIRQDNKNMIEKIKNAYLAAAPIGAELTAAKEVLDNALADAQKEYDNHKELIRGE